MNPRERRGIVFLALGLLGAVAALLLITNYTSSVKADVGPPTRVLKLREDVPAFTSITQDMVEVVDVPKKWRSEAAFSAYDEIVGMKTAGDLVHDSVLQQGMLQDPSDLAPGQREIAIMVDAETGVAGRIGGGSIVDIYATFTDANDMPTSEIIVSRALVLDVGVQSDDIADREADFTDASVVPVTFALSVEDSLRVTHAESFAQQVRLALIADGDSEPVSPRDRTYQPTRGAEG